MKISMHSCHYDLSTLFNGKFKQVVHTTSDTVDWEIFTFKFFCLLPRVKIIERAVQIAIAA